MADRPRAVDLDADEEAPPPPRRQGLPADPDQLVRPALHRVYIGVAIHLLWMRFLEPARPLALHRHRALAGARRPHHRPRIGRNGGENRTLRLHRRGRRQRRLRRGEPPRGRVRRARAASGGRRRQSEPHPLDAGGLHEVPRPRHLSHDAQDGAAAATRRARADHPAGKASGRRQRRQRHGLHARPSRRL